jgi:hypothetical protein
MHTNGADVMAHLQARIAELEAAHAIQARAIRETWGARLVAVEREVDVLLELVAASSSAVLALRRERANEERARRAEEESDGGIRKE